MLLIIGLQEYHARKINLPLLPGMTQSVGFRHVHNDETRIAEEMLCPSKVLVEYF